MTNLEMLYQTSRGLSTAHNEAELLQVLTQPVSNYGASGATLLYFDLDETGQPQWAEIVAGWRTVNPIGTRFYLPEFPIAHLWLSSPHEPLLIADVLTDERCNELTKQFALRVGTRATVIIPLTYAGRWIGLITFIWPTIHLFSDQEVELYHALQGLASPAVENRRMIGHLEQITAEQMKLNQQLQREIAERKHAENALQESQHMVLSIIQDVDIGVLLQGPQAEILLCNKTALELLGMSEEQLIGKTWFNIDWNVIHEDGRSFPRDTHPAPQAITTGQPVRNVIMGVYRPAFQDWVWLMVSAVPEIAPDGVIKHVVCSFSNITALKQAEEAARKSEQQYHSLFEYATDAIFVESLEGDILAVNEKACQLLRYEREELLSLKVRDIVPPRTAEEARAIHSALQQNKQLLMEGQNICKDGSLVDVEVSIRIIDLENQKVAQVFTRDITSRKQTEKALRESEQRFRAIFETSGVGIGLSDLQGRLLETNPAFQAMLGYSAEELRYKNFLQLTHPDDVEFEIENIQKELSGDKTAKSRFEKRYIRKGGQTIWARLTASFIRDGQNVPLYGLGFVEDITQQKLAEQQLQSYAAELERSNRELQDFAYVASHDLQEPLRKIQAFGDRLKYKYASVLDEQGQDYLERMQNAVVRMQTLIQDLLTFSRVTTRAQPFVPVDLTIVIEEVLSDLETRIEEVNGQVELDDLPTVYADYTQMRQLFQNLISNALKFHQPGQVPIIKIQSQLLPHPFIDSELCQITISDNGIGFDEKHLDRIFGVFQRLHSRREYEGTGVGLAVCRKIVERHGGTITARSKPGEGATFIISLPIKQISQ